MRALFILPLVAGCVVGGGEQEWSSEVERVEIRLGSGEVVVDTAPGITDTLVHWEGGGMGDNAFPDVLLQDGTMYIDANGGIAGGGEINVVAAEGVDIVVHLDRGSLDIALQAPANVRGCVAAGEVSIGVPAGPYRLDIPLAVGAREIDGIVNSEDAPYAISACVGAGELSVYSTSE